MKVFITGACGLCGSALAALPHEKICFDRFDPPPALGKCQFIKGDLSDLNLLRKGMQGCQAVIHLAGSSRPDSPWEEVLSNNIIGTYNIVKASVDMGVERIVFASSNHVVGMYELDNAPGIYELGHGIHIDKNAVIRPDSYYGMSKAFGENLGRYYAEKGGPRFYAIRIGSVRGAGEDHPYAYAESGVKRLLWKRGSKHYETQKKRLKAIWQSRRDFVQMVELCLKDEEAIFNIFYGISDNPRSWLDVEYAKVALGYRPRDNAEDWTNPKINNVGDVQPRFCYTKDPSERLNVETC